MQCQTVEKLNLHCLPSDPNVRKEWMNFMFNEVPDRVSKNSVLCSFHFAADLFTFTNKTIWCRIFRRIETKRQCCTDSIGSDSTGVSNCFYYNCFDSLFDIYWVFTAFNLNHSSVHRNQGDSHFWVAYKNISYLQHYITAIYLSPSVAGNPGSPALQMTSWCRCCCSLPAQGMG